MDSIKIIIFKFIYLMSVVIYSVTVSITTLYIIIFRSGKKYCHVKRRNHPPPCMTDPALGVQNSVKLKNVTLNYMSNGSSGPLLLLLHGFPEFWFSFRYQLKAFASDFRVVAYDMRGFGDSTKLAGVKNYTIDKLVEDVRELMISLDHKKAFLVGHDWGGVVAYHFTAKYPEMVDKLIILNAPHPKHFHHVLWTNWQQFFMSWYMFFFQARFLPEIMILGNDLNAFDKMFVDTDGNPLLTKDEMEAYKYIYSKPGAITCPLNYYRANFSFWNIFTKKQQTRITRPTLVIWGKKDPFLSIELATGAARYVDKFDFRLIEDGTHWIQVDKPDIVNKYIREFIAT